MKMFFGSVAVATVLAFASAVPADAASKSYCANVARHAANVQAAGKTIIGAGLGCLVARVFNARCGGGALVGGVGGFAIGSAKWNAVYNAKYNACRAS